MITPSSYRSAKARALYVGWAVAAWMFVVIATLNKDDSFPVIGTPVWLVLASALLGAFAVRAWRLTLEVRPHEVMIRNLFRSYRLLASELRAASFDGEAGIAPGLPGQTVNVECLRLELDRRPYSVDVTATMWLPGEQRRALLRRLKQMMKNH